MVNDKNLPLHDIQAESDELVIRDVWQAAMAKRRGIGGVALSNLREPFMIGDLDEAEQARAAHGLLISANQDDPEIAAAQKHIADAKEKYTYQSLGIRTYDEVVDPDKEIRKNVTVQKLVAARDVSTAHNTFAEFLPDFKKHFRQGVKKGIQQGYVPSYAADRLHNVLQKTSVRVADTLAISARGLDLVGYYDNEVDEIAVDHQIIDADDDYDLIVAHEFTHKLSGGTYLRNKKTGTYSQSRTGLGTQFGENAYKRVALNEAVTEHLSLGIMHGDFETLDPDQRKNDSDAYYSYRKVLSLFIKNSKGIIDLKTITNAYFEDADQSGAADARKKMLKEFTDAYGKGALKNFEALCAHSELLPDAGIESFIESRITRPVIDDQGEVIRAGSIDASPPLQIFGNPEHIAAALQAAKQFKFKHTMLRNVVNKPL